MSEMELSDFDCAKMLTQTVITVGILLPARLATQLANKGVISN
jgi:hypothetical protein